VNEGAGIFEKQARLIVIALLVAYKSKGQHILSDGRRGPAELGYLVVML